MDPFRTSSRAFPPPVVPAAIVGPPGRPAFHERRTPLETDFATLLTSVADTGGPLNRIGDWFDRHEDAFRGEGAGTELRTVVQEALAVCWSRRHRQLTDTAARAQPRGLAGRLRKTTADQIRRSPVPAGPL